MNAAGVQYMVVGGYAVMVHTEPRYTKDLDLWIKPELKNAQALLAALSEFGAPIADVRPEDFTEPEVFFQIGVDPVRVDILTSVLGLEFETAWARKIAVDFGEVRCFPGKTSLPPNSLPAVPKIAETPVNFKTKNRGSPPRELPGSFYIVCRNSA